MYLQNWVLFLLCVLSMAHAKASPFPGEFDDIFVPNTTLTSTTTLQPKTDEDCVCVPNYLCADGIAEDLNDPCLTGAGEINLRLQQCSGSIEVCCKKPMTEKNVRNCFSNDTGCGYRNRKGIDFRVTGGTGHEAQFGEFPWVVAVMVLKDSQIYNFGVGALIHSKVILTAAHIIDKYSQNPEKIIIRAGEWDALTEQESLKHQDEFVKEVYIHKDYVRAPIKNDIALLLLEKPMVLNEHINVICMPDQGEDFSKSKDCVANGWGRDTFSSQSYSRILKRVELGMVDSAQCESQIKKLRRFQMHSSLLCAGGEEGEDTCMGDGGAPLVCPVGEDDRYKVAGLVVGGVECGKKDVPAVYTNVAMFRKWVDDKMAAWGFNISGYKYDKKGL